VAEREARAAYIDQLLSDLKSHLLQGPQKNNPHYLPEPLRGEVLKLLDAGVAGGTEQTLEEQARAWLDYREFLAHTQERFRQETLAFVIFDKPEYTDPDSLHEPLRTAVLREMARVKG
jgi:hypothetical protein